MLYKNNISTQGLICRYKRGAINWTYKVQGTSMIFTLIKSGWYLYFDYIHVQAKGFIKLNQGYCDFQDIYTVDLTVLFQRLYVYFGCKLRQTQPERKERAIQLLTPLRSSARVSCLSKTRTLAGYSVRLERGQFKAPVGRHFHHSSPPCEKLYLGFSEKESLRANEINKFSDSSYSDSK